MCKTLFKERVKCQKINERERLNCVKWITLKLTHILSQSLYNYNKNYFKLKFAPQVLQIVNSQFYVTFSRIKYYI